MNKRGVALIISYMVIAVLTVLGAAFMLRSISEGRISNNYLQSNQALWLADAGIQKAVWELNKNSCVGCSQCGTVTPCANCTCSSASKCVSGTLGSFGDYDATIDSANTTITSIGSVPSRSVANKVTRSVKVTLTGGSVFSYASFAQGSISISPNTLVDSYNSSLGDYGIGNTGSNGDIGTNSSASGAITIGNNVSIYGDASTGPSGTITQGSNTQISGSTTNTNNVTLTPVVVPSNLTSLTNAGDLFPAHGTATSKTLSAGNYKYSSVNIPGNGTVTINGTVNLYLTGSSSISTGNNVNIVVASGAKLTVYVDGKVDISNNAIVNNISKIPANFQIYSTYSGASGVLLDNNTEFYGAVYAPTTSVSVSNNVGVYGAIVGQTVNLANNSSVHYDEALRQVTGQGSSGYTISDWQEI
ncbi:MAG: hypothetical protein NTW13_01175 [Candidatus Omnitrophica bacterium]|nr:hypothetical protein [Candidatus Omnitrophota bacterium]